MQRKHAVEPSESWGSLGPNGQQQWTALGCDSRVFHGAAAAPTRAAALTRTATTVESRDRPPPETRSPSRSPTRTPNRSPTRTPDRSPDRSPNRASRPSRRGSLVGAGSSRSPEPRKPTTTWLPGRNPNRSPKPSRSPEPRAMSTWLPGRPRDAAASSFARSTKPGLARPLPRLSLEPRQPTRPPEPSPERLKPTARNAAEREASAALDIYWKEPSTYELENDERANARPRRRPTSDDSDDDFDAVWNAPPPPLARSGRR